MCFSATASFGASVVLGTIGAVSVIKAKKSSQKMFAAIPLIFAIQQACEGFLWLTLTLDNFESSQITATYSFLFFAQILWPIWVPVSILLMEQEEKCKRWLQFASLSGILCSLIMIYRIISFNVFAEVQNHHILYHVNNSITWITISSILYFISTVVPAFMSSIRHMKLLGILSFGSLTISRLFYKMYFISVWCFFAAILSIVVIYILKNINERTFSEEEDYKSSNRKHAN